MNKVILMGRLTRDPNVRYTQQNGSQESMCVARYTLAVDRRGARDGQQSADFISCVAFGKNGEFAEKYLKQGTKIVVTGRIQTGSYTNRDGQKVYTTDERYTDAESLKEDAEAKLDELSKPYRSYTAEIINLVEAVQDEEKKEQYKEVFSIALGDTVLLISKSTGIRESHRIVKFYEYPLTKEKNKVELANTRLSFEEVQRTEQELS